MDRFMRRIGWVMFLLGGPAWVQGDAGKAPFLHLRSQTFQDGGMIPDAYTCSGKNTSPELNWKNAPPGTKCFALIVDDPDAPSRTWVHWVLYNIPEKSTAVEKVYELLEGFPRDEVSNGGIRQGANDFGRIGYDGPCPPSGTHRYYFKLYALDSLLPLPAGATKDRLLKAMKGHILAWTQIMGLYGK
jgi:Raf kinase inhibitor-like YbhB/YbcL family protein